MDQEMVAVTTAKDVREALRAQLASDIMSVTWSMICFSLRRGALCDYLCWRSIERRATCSR